MRKVKKYIKNRLYTKIFPLHLTAHSPCFSVKVKFSSLANIKKNIKYSSFNVVINIISIGKHSAMQNT